MFYVSSISGTKYGITDTSDGVEEFYDKEFILNLNLKILGVNTNKRVIKVIDTESLINYQISKLVLLGKFPSRNFNLLVERDFTLTFNDDVSLDTLVVPYGVRHLENLEYSTLREIVLPETLIELAPRCFSMCRNLSQIKLPNSLETLGGSCFYGCRSLKKIEIPNKITYLPTACFRSCISLEYVKLPNNLIHLDDSCFFRCKSLVKLILPNSLRKIGWNCFEQCENLVNIEIPPNVIELGDFCFKQCESLINIKLPNSIKRFGTCHILRSFEGCDNLKQNLKGIIFYG